VHEEVTSFLRTLMGRFTEQSAITGKTAAELVRVLDADAHHLPLAGVSVGHAASEQLERICQAAGSSLTTLAADLAGSEQTAGSLALQLTTLVNQLSNGQALMARRQALVDKASQIIYEGDHNLHQRLAPVRSEMQLVDAMIAVVRQQQQPQEAAAAAVRQQQSALQQRQAALRRVLTFLQEAQRYCIEAAKQAAKRLPLDPVTKLVGCFSLARITRATAPQAVELAKCFPQVSACIPWPGQQPAHNQAQNALSPLPASQSN
jgi:hypothetical protein